MYRIAVLVGVARTGGGTLPPLRAVRSGITRVAGWAHGQGFADVVILTDEADPVTLRGVLEVVDGVVRAGPDQLLVYFAGHGVNVGRSEFWLLSDAPRFASEAVDVMASTHLARACGIPHVVLISDACRSAAECRRMQSVSGAPIFPNEDLGLSSGHVDHFLACALGSPSYEIRDPGDAAARYRAVYTDALVDALDGHAERALDWEGRVARVRPWPLRDHLEEEVGRRLARLRPGDVLTQVPDARISSPPSAWISELHDLDLTGRPEPTRDVGPGSLPATVRTAIHEHLSAWSTTRTPALRRAVDLGVPGAADLMAASDRLLVPVDPGPIRTPAAIALRGAAVRRVSTAQAILRPDGRGVIAIAPGPGILALVELGDGSSVAVPVLDGRLTAVTVEDDEVVDVTVEPVGRRPDRRLHALVAAAARRGVLSVDEDDLAGLADEAVSGSGADPVLALIAAYELPPSHDGVAGLRRGVGPLVDRALPDLRLIERSGSRRPWEARTIVPFPLLAQGWPLLALTPLATVLPIDTLRGHLRPSIWTQFTPRGTQLVRDLILPRWT